MPKSIFVVRGVSNSGKTHTIRHIAETLVVRYMGKHKNSVNIAEVNISVEVRWGTVKSEELLCVITIAYGPVKVIIGICTAGDTPDVITERFPQLLAKGCDIIICGCKGLSENNDNTVFDIIVKTAAGYTVHTENTSHTKDEPDDPIDSRVAEKILDDVCDMIDNALALPQGKNTFIHP